MGPMEINLPLDIDHAELLISVLENEMENLEQDHDIQEKLKRGLADDDIADYYTALNMIKEEIRVRLEEK